MKDKNKNDLKNLDPSSRFRKEKKKADEQAERTMCVENISKKLDKDPADVLLEFNRVREKYDGDYGLMLITYHDYEMYRMSGEEMDQTVSLLQKRIALRKQFQSIYYDTDAYLDQIDELERLYAELTEIDRKLITETLKNKYKEIFRFRYPEIESDDSALTEVAVDFITLHSACGFSDVDYKLYDLFPKQLSEKLSFVSRREMTRIIKEFNSPDLRPVFDDKARCYEKFSADYRRKVVPVKSMRDVLRMSLFCRHCPEFVKKPVFALAGRGVAKVNVRDYKSVADMVRSILSEDGEFVAEELVQGHPSISVFNPDSLNTIRIVTFNAGKKIEALDESSEAFRRGMLRYMGNGVYCCAPFFKTGRSGSFVDNAGAGGVFTAIDLNDGTCSGIATGEDGTDHTAHPDTGVNFDSLRFENFSDAEEIAAKLALQIPEVRVIGWDLALNDKAEWVLIEANYAPTLIGQAPARHGLHNEMRLLVHFS